MKVIYETPVLISKTKAGEEKFWQGRILTDKKHYFRQAVTWRTTANGKPSKQLISEPYEIYPKNEGRANATTAKEQAHLEMESIVKKQHDKGYHEKGKKSNVLPLPMLANKFKDKMHNIDWDKGVYVQPKYNGMRMLWDGKKGWSRGGKEIIPEVIQHLLPFNTDGYVMDGELILPDMPVLQETMKAAKKYRKGISDKLMYCVFDVVEPTLSYKEREGIFAGLVARASAKIIPVIAKKVHSPEELMELHNYFTRQGFEGSIIRIDGHGYEIGHRSNYLLKLKDFVDAEFKIVDVIEGDGKFKGHAIFVCETKKGIRFNCTPEGEMSYRKELYNNRKKHIGKWLTIRYQELTNDGVPQFPVGVDIREKGDF